MCLTFKVRPSADIFEALSNIERMTPCSERDSFDGEYRPTGSESSEDDLSMVEHIHPRHIDSHARTKYSSKSHHSEILGLPNNAPPTKSTTSSISEEQAATVSHRTPTKMQEDWSQMLERDGYVLISDPAPQLRMPEETKTNTNSVTKSGKCTEGALCDDSTGSKRRNEGGKDSTCGLDSRSVKAPQNQRTDTHKRHGSPLKTQEEAYLQHLSSAAQGDPRNDGHVYQLSKTPSKDLETEFVARIRYTDFQKSSPSVSHSGQQTVVTSTRDSPSHTAFRTEPDMIQVGIAASYDQHPAHTRQCSESLAERHQQAPDIGHMRGNSTPPTCSMPLRSAELGHEIAPWAIQLGELIARACVSKLEKGSLGAKLMANLNGLQRQAVTDPAEESLTATATPQEWQTQEAQGLDGIEEGQTDSATTASEQNLRDYPEISRKVPRANRLSWQELITVGRIINSYQRHWKAPYAFSRCGHLLVKYRRLLKKSDAHGRKWSAKEITRVLKSKQPYGPTLEELEGRASSMKL